MGTAIRFICICVLMLFLGSCRSFGVDQFGLADPVRPARARSAVTLSELRITPATLITGTHSLTLDDCRSLALTRNLDVHAARAEEMIKAAIDKGNRTRLLPHLLVSGELSERDNYGYAFSDVIGQEGRTPNPGASTAGGTGVTNFSVGHERSTWRYAIETNWSPTDAALAYYLAKNSGNDRTRARFQRIRVGQKLVATVEAAFFRRLSLQRRKPCAERLAALRARVREQTEALARSKLKTSEDEYRSGQRALRAARLVSAIAEELEKQHNTLASSLFLSPDQSVDGGFVVEGALDMPCFRDEIPSMEMKAIQNRPECVEAGLNLANSMNDVRRTIVKYFPKIVGFWRYTRDKDRYLYNKEWKDVGIRVNYDLGEVLTNRQEARAARSAADKADIIGAAVAIGITAQVRSAALAYFRTLREVEYAEIGLRMSRKALLSARAKTADNDLTKLALLDIEADALEEEIEWLRALGEAQAALAELRSAMGTNYQES
ncbi:MAG: TolC family protein [Thermodesulfobacteriota bacterium]